MSVAIMAAAISGCGMVDVPNNPEFANAIRSTAERLGVNPVDLATAVSYETAGSFDPWQKGPTTKWGTHRGLIQFGEPQRQKYGVYEGQSAAEQMGSVEAYLRDTGVKKGHGLLDIYSAINAGGVGRYNRSDAAAGGAPGTVADKVAGMAPHRVRAELLLNGKLPAGLGEARAEARPNVALPPGYGVGGPEHRPQQVAGAAPFSIAPAGPSDAEGDGFAAMLEAAKRLAADRREEEDDMPDALPPLQILSPMMGAVDRRRMRG